MVFLGGVFEDFPDILPYVSTSLYEITVKTMNMKRTDLNLIFGLSQARASSTLAQDFFFTRRLKKVLSNLFSSPDLRFTFITGV